MSWDDFVEFSVDEARDFGTVQHRVVRQLRAPLAALIAQSLSEISRCSSSNATLGHRPK